MLDSAIMVGRPFICRILPTLIVYFAGPVKRQHLKPLVVTLMGATASGKTALALELAARVPIDIISVDSAMVYRGMDIGTAKPSKETLKNHPHALIDVRDPPVAYSAQKLYRTSRSGDTGSVGARARASAGRRHDDVFQCFQGRLGEASSGRYRCTSNYRTAW
ncbi:MAG: hypothetical protein CM1200mP9_02650 [Gammaproteobacteria bacterium]|nr:MAG: hypothetical protein CM1200mP9_02650 [Gammaproteobacteria bacterium]